MARSRAARLGQAVLDLIIDDSKFHSKLSGAYKAAQNFTSQTGSNLTKAGRAISGFGESWSRNISAPIALAGGVVTKFGLDFDTTMTEVVALTSVTQDQIGGIREELIKLGPEVGKSPQELAEAFYFVASAGFEGAEALDVTRNAAKAAAAGLGDTATVAKVVGTAINAYGRDNITAAEATDTLVAAIGEGSAEAPEFAGALGNVIGSAAQIGASFPDVTAAIAAMTNVGIGAEEAVTSLNQVFVSLFKPTAEAAEALEGMGLSAAGLRTMIAEQGLLPTLQMLAEKFEGNAEATATVFGNVRALRGVLALTGGDAEKTAGIFERMQDTVGATGEAFATVAESDAFKFRQSMAELEATAIELGTDVLPIVVEVLREVAGMARGLSKWWRTLDDDTKQLVIRALALVAVMGPVLIIVGKLTTGIGQLVKAVSFLAGPKGIVRLGSAFSGLLGPIGLAAAALGALTILGEEVFKSLNPDEYNFNQLAAKTGRSRIAIQREVDQLAHDLGRSSEDIKRELADLLIRGIDWDAAVDAVRDGTAAMTHSVEEEAESFDQAMLQYARSASERSGEAADAVGDLPPEVVAILEEAGIPIGDAADGTMGEIDEAAAAAREAAVDHMRGMLQGITSLFETDETLQQAWNDLIERMDDPYTEAERKADIFSQNTIANIRAAIQAGDPDVTGDTVGLVNNMLAQIALMEPGALEAGEAVPPAVREGMDAEMGALIDWIETNVTGESLSAMSLEDAREVGIEGIWKYNEGMLANERAATTAASRVGNAALDSLIDEQSWTSAGRNIVDLIANGVDERTWRLQSAVRGAAQAARIVLPDSEPKDPHSPLRGLGHTGEALVDMVAGGVLGNLGTARSAMMALAEVLTPTLGSWHVPTIATPSLPDLAEMAATSTTAEGLGATIEHREYHLHYNGRDTLFGNPGAFLRELEEINRFDEEGV